MLERREAKGDDPLIVVLQLQNTPTMAPGMSLTKSLFGRRTIAMLLVSPGLLDPDVGSSLFIK